MSLLGAFLRFSTFGKEVVETLFYYLASGEVTAKGKYTITIY
jgi:hypothetical protein